MKNDNFKSLVFGPKCTGPKSIGPKYFRAEVVSGAEVFSGRSISGPKYFPGRSIHRAEVVSGRSISGPKCFGPKYFRAEVSVGPKRSLGQTGCEPEKRHRVFFPMLVKFQSAEPRDEASSLKNQRQIWVVFSY